MNKLLFCATVLTAAAMFDISAAFAVTANPLEDAYWRFEEGPDATPVFPGVDNVLDSINDNDVRAADPFTAPTYTSTVAPFMLRSGDANSLALEFTPHTDGGDDLFTSEKDIDNGIIASGGGFTLEAAFRPNAVNAFQAIVAKEGLPSGPLPTLALKVRGDNGNLQIEQFDNAGNLVDVQSSSPLSAGQWYAAAAVNDGSTLSLYLRSETTNDYVFQGSTPVDEALYQGTSDSWDKAWAIGRGVFNSDVARPDGIPADWFNGIIDEVRLSNRALTPSEFLFKPVPEPHGILLAFVAIVGVSGRRLARSKRR